MILIIFVKYIKISFILLPQKGIKTSILVRLLDNKIIFYLLMVVGTPTADAATT